MTLNALRMLVMWEVEMFQLIAPNSSDLWMFVLYQIPPTSQRRWRTVKLNIQSTRNLLS